MKATVRNWKGLESVIRMQTDLCKDFEIVGVGWRDSPFGDRKLDFLEIEFIKKTTQKTSEAKKND